MADLVHEGGSVGNEELNVLEKSGILVSQKLKGKAKARPMNGPKHIVFVEEGEEGPSCLASIWEIYPDLAVRYIRRTFEPRSYPRDCSR